MNPVGLDEYVTKDLFEEFERLANDSQYYELELLKRYTKAKLAYLKIKYSHEKDDL